MKKRLAFFNLTKLLLICCILMTALSGCSKVKTPITKSGTYFDTVISITLYESNSSKLIDECFLLAEKYDNLLSKTNPSSDVSKINSSFNEWISVDEETYSIIKTGLKYEKLSNGRFSVMCGALTDLWDISEKAIVPSDKDIKEALVLCGMDTIEMDDSTYSIKIIKQGAKLDLGAIAKGYIADEIKSLLLSRGVTSGIIQLGGNVLLIGENPTKEDGHYSVGITLPFADADSEVLAVLGLSSSGSSQNGVATVISETDNSIVTSGNYQRFFLYDSKIYHHIIDLKTGYPANTGLNSVSVICRQSVDADCLSTVLFLLGKEKGAELIDSLNSSDNATDIRAIFITNENEIIE